MPTFVNAETFQLRTGEDIRPLTAERGLAVTTVNFHRPAPYQRKYLDPQIEPYHTTSLGRAPIEQMLLELDKQNPPKVLERSGDKDLGIARSNDLVYSCSVDIESLRELLNELTKGHHTEPAKIYRNVINPAGRIALVSVIDHTPASHTFGEPYDLSVEGPSMLLFGFRADGMRPAGAALVVVPEDASMVVGHSLRTGKTETRRQVRFTYRPDSQRGFELTFAHPPGRDEEAPEEQDWLEGDDDREDSGGSDREPRNPLWPASSGTVEADPHAPDTVAIEERGYVL